MENSNLDLRSPDTSTDTLSPELNSNVEPVDLEGLALLRQIFPEESTEELCKLHEQRILLKSAEKKRRAMDEMIPKSLPSSNIGRKIWRELQELMGEQNESQQQAGSEFQNCEQGLNWRAENLPEDFLRLPAEVAVRRKNDHTGKWEYQLVVDLERRAFAQHRRYYTTGEPLSNDLFFTKVIPRDSDNGLGITLVEDHGRVRIHAVSDLHTSSDSDGSTSNRHKSSDLSIMTGDCVVGVNGYAIFEISFKHHSILRQTVAMIRSSPSPVVLHLQRLQRVPHQKAFSPMPTRPPPESTPALLDTTIDESFRLSSPFDEANHLRLPALHPFAQALASRGLLRNTADQVYISEMIQQFIERARQFEFSNSFRIDANTFQLLPNFDNARASYDFEEVKEQTPSTPSTPLRSCNNNGMESLDTASSNDQFRGRGDSFDSLSQLSSPSRSSYPGSRFRTPDRSRRRNADIFIPLMGVRKALCIRILNHFIDGDHVAYTIFVKDVESGVEFYAPLRYFSDFQDLRSATLHLNPKVGQIPFPSQGWSFFGYNEANNSEAIRETKCRQLESFLRTLSAQIYTDDLHPSVAEIAIHLQSFLGADSISLMQNSVQFAASQAGDSPDCTIPLTCGGEAAHDQHYKSLKTLLKRSLQMYIYRIFLLHPMRVLVGQFVDSARANGPSLHDIESMQVQGNSVLKKRAMQELQQIQRVVDQLQDLLLDGCMDDFRSISKHNNFAPLRPFLAGDKGGIFWDRLVREAAREQIEVEVYLPLRSTTSRLLVNAWRHEDMAVSFKVHELKKRSQEFFRIPGDKASPSEWHSVSCLLKEVQNSTLPSAKLRAIVEAASEINNLYREEHPKAVSKTSSDSGLEALDLGADDFLPIFIFSVIRAEMERPCALSVLLRTLCDPINRLGEIGYYLASFEAAVTHIKEIDLSESREEMFSFLSIPLSDTSFD